MRKTYITALGIAAAITIWFLSGQWDNQGPIRHQTLAEINAQSRAIQQDKAPTRIRARVIHASPQLKHVVLRGKTIAKRTVQVRAETSGRIVERPVERGTVVSEGDLLCQISMEDRYVGLIESRESLNQARIEYQGSLTLKKKGFQSDTAIAQAKARLAAAEAELKRSQLDISRTYVRAPFAGVVEDIHQEVGDFVTSGAACVTVVDLDPMLLVGRVAERDVNLLELLQPATGILSDGRKVTGPVTFIGQQSDPATRTYAVEVQISNDDYAVRSGLTTEIRIPVAEVLAQKISPAVFALDDAGNIGVRIVNADSRVEFHRVEIVREDLDGVWIVGLPEIATVITVGHELVVHGELVGVDFEPTNEMPAAAPIPEAAQPASQIGQEPEAATGIALKT
jgi:multidrug efflux system membrane fusion protein